MFAPIREQCGVSDYSRLLKEALRTLPEIARVRIVNTPGERVTEEGQELPAFVGSEDARFYALGGSLNKDADVAHVQHQYFFFGGVAPHKNHAKAFLDAVRVPVVITVHEIAQPDAKANLLVRAAIRLTNQRNFKHRAIRALIVHTPTDREHLLALGIRPEKIYVLTHPIPAAAPMPAMEDAKRALDLTGRRVVTLFGFLAAKKGHLTALTALPLLLQDVVLVFAGGQHPQDHTDYVPMLRRYIATHGLEARVRITGYLDEAQIPVVMAATDAAITPFTQTSGSGSLANLFAYGRAVVASDIAPHQVIAREQPGCLDLFHAEDAADLATHIQAVLDNPTRRQTLQHAALAYAQNHSYLKMARQTAEIYEGIREEGKGKR